MFILNLLYPILSARNKRLVDFIRAYGKYKNKVVISYGDPNSNGMFDYTYQYSGDSKAAFTVSKEVCTKIFQDVTDDRQPEAETKGQEGVASESKI